MGKGLVEKLQREFDLSADWLGYEIHPETPKQGMPISMLPMKVDPKVMMKHLCFSEAPVGITFNEISLLPNSRMALEAAEYARKHDTFDVFHTALFEAYFLKGQNIGELEVK